MCCGFADLFNCRVAKLRLARRLDLYLLYFCLHAAPNNKEGAAGRGRRDSGLPKAAEPRWGFQAGKGTEGGLLDCVSNRKPQGRPDQSPQEELAQPSSWPPAPPEGGPRAAMPPCILHF